MAIWWAKLDCHWVFSAKSLCLNCSWHSFRTFDLHGHVDFYVGAVGSGCYIPARLAQMLEIVAIHQFETPPSLASSIGNLKLLLRLLDGTSKLMSWVEQRCQSELPMMNSKYKKKGSLSLANRTLRLLSQTGLRRAWISTLNPMSFWRSSLCWDSM